MASTSIAAESIASTSKEATKKQASECDIVAPEWLCLLAHN